ncbi:glycosyltransferase family 4 protein [Calditrichota bacterium]
MKILEINTEKTWRGGERQTVRQIRGFIKAGLDVELLCRRGSPLVQKLLSMGITVHETISSFEALSFLLRLGNEYDCIHCQTAKAQSLAVLTKSVHKRPIIYTRRVDFKPKGLTTKLKYRQTDKIIAISQAIRQVLENIGLENIDVVPSIAEREDQDFSKIDSLKKSMDIQNRKVIATVAAMVPHKDPWTMVNTIEELNSKRHDFLFIHFGSGELIDEIRMLVKNKNLTDVYRILGFVDEVEKLYAMFDVFVMSSEEEGLGSGVFDAFLNKVPVVSTDAGGLKELVSGRGITCAVKDHKSLATAINRLLDNPDCTKEMVEKAFDDTLKKYSTDILTQPYIRIFTDLSQDFPKS